MRRVALAVPVVLCALVTASTASADLRVYEANAPRSERAHEQREGLGRFIEEALRPAPPAPSSEAPYARVDDEDAEAPETSSGNAPRAESAPPSDRPSESDDTSSSATVEVAVLSRPETPAHGSEVETSDAHAPSSRSSWFDDHRWLDITGFLQPGFIARFDDPTDGVSVGNTDETFWLQRARLGARAQIFEWLRFRIEVEFTPTTSLQDGFIDIAPHPFFNVRAGQFIVPFLRTFSFNEVNLGYIDRALYTPVQFERGYIRYLAPRDMGLMVFGAFGDRSPESSSPVVEYQLAAMNGRGPNLPINDDFVFLYAGRLNVHVLGLPVGHEAESDIARNDRARVDVGFAGYSNCDDRGNWNRGVTMDAEFRYDGFYASAAYVWFRNSAGDGTAVFTSERCVGTPGPIMGERADFVSRGAHAQLQWALPRFWRELGAPADGMDIELLARFDWVDGNSPYDGTFLGAGGPDHPGYVVPTDYTNADNPPTRWRLTFGLNYFPTGQQTIKLAVNYQLNREAETVDTGMGIVQQVANDVLWLQATVAL